MHSAFLHNSVNDVRAANIFADRFDIHRGFLDIGWGNSFGGRIRIGRQKFNLGAQRLVASLEWVNTARVWDGVRFSQRLGSEQRVLDVFASRLVPVRPRAFNSHARTGNRMFDSQFHGLYLTDRISIPHSRAELYYLQRRNTHVGDLVHTWGLRYAWRHNGWDADTELMLQHGSFAFLKHRAEAAHIGIGHMLAPGWHLGGAYNFGSGDANAKDGKHQTFDNLYPLNHAYYGYMDLFSLQNLHNAEAVLRWQPDARRTLRLAWEGFRLARSSSDAWYNAGGGVLRRAALAAPAFVGHEVDVTLASRFPKQHFTALLGFSHFFAGAFVRRSGTSRDANFFFAQGKYTF